MTASIAAVRTEAVKRARRRGGIVPPWWFAVPAILVYALVVLYPSIAGAGSAFTDWSGVGNAKSFVGVANFKQLLHDDQALGGLRKRLLLSVAIVVVQIGVGWLLARGVRSRIQAPMLASRGAFAPRRAS